MVSRSEWTLSEAARLLKEPQHRLIYLCEKGVVKPDLQEAQGRGSSRRFSARNLLEFAVALRLRELEIAASLVAAVIYVLRAFESSVGQQIPGFRLPESLRNQNAPDLRAVIGDGQRLYFTLRDGKADPKVYGGIELRKFDSAERSTGALRRSLSRPTESDGRPEGAQHARVEISITSIARELQLEV